MDKFILAVWNTKINGLILLNFVYLRDLVPSWQKNLADIFVQKFS